jgi:non-specific serine/threonine protein kinase
VRALPPDQIARRLDDRFRLLTGGSRTALPRQQTLRALIDWSYDLLDERERVLFRRLSVFAGGWTLEACEAVCAIGDVDEWEILDLLSHLVDKSLVVFDDQGYAETADGTAAEPRYRLSETIRQYGRDRLLESGEGALLRDRHRDFFLRLAEQADACLRGPESARWLHRLEQEHDNLRAALEWSRGAPDGDGLVGLRLAGALARFWETRGYLREGRQHLSDALALPGADAPTEERATALAGAGMLATDQGAHEEAQALYEQSLAIRRARGDRRGVANTLNSQGLLAWNQGDYASAHALCEESLAMWREIGDKRGMAGCLNNLANAAAMQGDRAAARAYYEEALRLNRELGNKTWEAHILNNMGDMANEEGILPALVRCIEKASHCCVIWATGTPWTRCWSPRGSGDEWRQGERSAAAARRAVRLLAAAQALRDAVGTVLPLNDRVEFEQHVSRCAALLGEETFAAAWSEGQRMTLEQAVAYALAEENASA